MQEGALVTRFDFTGDYYSLPNLLPLVSGRGLIDLVDEIMQTPLPKAAGLSRESDEMKRLDELLNC